MASDIRFYISVFLRRLHYFALVAIVFSAAGVATAIILPTKYASDALLLVESPQIPDELAATTVRTNSQEQLQIIEQRLLTRDNLIEIAHELDVFSDIDRLFPDEVVERMRESTTFRVSGGRNKASLVRIMFEAERAEAAAAVTNAYVTRVLRSNVELRTDRAEGTVEFFQQELERLGFDLSEKSAEILQFKNENINALPENLSYQLARHDNRADRITEINREIAGLDQQRERLVMVFNATGGASRNSDSLLSDEMRELRQAEENLSQLLVVYSEQNPRVKALKARVDILRERVQPEGSSETDAPDAGQAILDIQLAEIDNRKQGLEEERVGLEDEITEIRENLDAIPSNSVLLESLTRDYENLQQQYNLTVQRASAAQTGERIEQLSKGERISVINQPTVPREPSSPNRPFIAAAGIAVGIGAGAALVFLLEILNRSIRRPVDLTRSLGITPLATLPLMRTPGEIALRRAVVVSVILFGTLGMVAAVYYTHTQFMPLDQLASRAINKFGL